MRIKRGTIVFILFILLFLCSCSKGSNVVEKNEDDVVENNVTSVVEEKNPYLSGVYKGTDTYGLSFYRPKNEMFEFYNNTLFDIKPTYIEKLDGLFSNIKSVSFDLDKNISLYDVSCYEESPEYYYYVFYIDEKLYLVGYIHSDITVINLFYELETYNDEVFSFVSRFGWYDKTFEAACDKYTIGPQNYYAITDVNAYISFEKEFDEKFELNELGISRMENKFDNYVIFVYSGYFYNYRKQHRDFFYDEEKNMISYECSSDYPENSGILAISNDKCLFYVHVPRSIYNKMIES